MSSPQKEWHQSIQEQIMQRINEIQQKQKEIHELQSKLNMSSSAYNCTADTANSELKQLSSANTSSFTQIANFTPYQPLKTIPEDEKKSPVKKQSERITRSPIKSPGKRTILNKGSSQKQIAVQPREDSQQDVVYVDCTSGTNNTKYIKLRYDESPPQQSPIVTKSQTQLYPSISQTQPRCSSPLKWRNEELENATAAIQAEFDKLLHKKVEAGERRLSPERRVQADDGFQQIMQEMSESYPLKKHKSPTKRLIDQKNSAWEHKNEFQKRVSSPARQYKINYTTQPGKSFIVAPEGGELNYALARRDPANFYDQVIAQNITEFKATSPSPRRTKGSPRVEITQRVTHRKIGRILMLVQSELVEVLRKNYTYVQLCAAFKDPRVMQQIQKHVQNKNIQLRHHQSNEPLFEEEMLLIGQKGPENAQSSQSPRGETDPESQIKHANLIVHEDAIADVHTEVKAFLKRSKNYKQ